MPSNQQRWEFYVKLVHHRHQKAPPKHVQILSESELNYLSRLLGWGFLIKFINDYFIPTRNVTVQQMACWATLATRILLRNPDRNFPHELRRVRPRLLKKVATQLNELELKLRTARRHFHMKKILKSTGLGKYYKAMQTAGLKWQV